MDGCAYRLRERTEYMLSHLCRVSAEHGGAEGAFEHQKGPPTEVDRNLCFRFVHRQDKPKAGDTTPRCERFAQRLAQRYRAIFDAVVCIYVEVARAGKRQRKAAMVSHLLQHVIEEANTARDAYRRGSIEIDADGYRSEYLKAIGEFRQTYQRECRQSRIDYVPLDTSMPFDRALMEYLVSRRNWG